MLRPDPAAVAAASPAAVERHHDVMAALGDVLDPELDEAVTDMGFIESVAIDATVVAVTFRLPTFWCSANFAFLMAVDMRHAVERLDWVERAEIKLVDHFAARKINRGVAAGHSFSRVFEGEAQGDLDEIRRIFRERAFLGRQERLLRLLAGRWGIATTLGVTLADLNGLASHDDRDIRMPALRYLAVRRHDGLATRPESPAFVTLTGEAVEAAGYPAYLRELRKVRGTAEANAEMCRLYLEARTTHPAPGCGIADRDPNEA